MTKKRRNNPPVITPKVKKKSPSKITPLEAFAKAYRITIFQAIAAIGNPVLWEIIGGEVIGGGEAEQGSAAAVHEYMQKYAAKANKKSKK